MLIKKVKISGFNNIFEGVEKGRSDGRGSDFGTEFGNFLNHARIFLDLDQLTTIEVFYLKKFASSIHILESTYSNFISEEKDPVINQKIAGLLEIHDEILKDDDINKNKYEVDNLLPIGCKRYHVIASFKGIDILSVTGGIIQNIFKDPKTDTRDPAYIGNTIMENRLASLFYNSFYKFIIDSMTQFDLVTTYILNKKFYQYGKNEASASLASVSSPWGELSFFGNSSQALMNQITSIQQTQATMPYLLTDEVTLTFVVNSSINTFLYYYFKNKVIDHQHLQVAIMDSGVNISNEILLKYQKRIEHFLTYIAEYKQEKFVAKQEEKNTTFDLNEFNYLFFGNSITYSLQVTIDDIENWLKNIDIDDIKDEQMTIQTDILEAYNRIKSIIS